MIASAKHRPAGIDASNGAGCVDLGGAGGLGRMHGAGLNAWQRVAADFPSMERAHVRLAQLLLDEGKLRQAQSDTEYPSRAWLGEQCVSGELTLIARGRS